MRPPESWDIVARDLWCLPENEARAFWQALSHSTRARSQAMRHRFSLAGFTHISQRFWQDFCAPAVVMAVLEELHQERRLTRARTSRIEEHLLRHVTRHGVWRGEGWDGRERLSTHAPDVIMFAEVGRL